MLGFGFDVPSFDLYYQAKVEVHVIKEVSHSSLTPQLKPPPVVIKRVKPERRWVVYFDYDSDVLRDEEKKKLERVKKGIRVEVEGYASPEGRGEYNLDLSFRRAKRVGEFLKKRGVKVLKIKGLGEKSCSLGPSLWSECRKVEVRER